MKFESLDPSVVRSIRQIDLLNAWLRLLPAADAPAPALVAFRPERIAEEEADLVRYRVSWQGDAPAITVDSDGARVVAAYGVGGDHHGLALEAVLGPVIAADVLPVFLACIHRARPVFTVADVVDVDGHPVRYERLVLPFSDGGRVAALLASIKAISEDGRFELRNLLHGEDRRPVFRLRGVIDQPRRRANASPADDIITV